MIPPRHDHMPGRTPIVTRTFVGLWVLVFLWQMTLGPQGGQAAVYALGVIPALLLGRATAPAPGSPAPSVRALRQPRRAARGRDAARGARDRSAVAHRADVDVHARRLHA